MESISEIWTQRNCVLILSLKQKLVFHTYYWYTNEVNAYHSKIAAQVNWPVINTPITEVHKNFVTVKDFLWGINPFRLEKMLVRKMLNYFTKQLLPTWIYFPVFQVSDHLINNWVILLIQLSRRYLIVENLIRLQIFTGEIELNWAILSTVNFLSCK